MKVAPGKIANLPPGEAPKRSPGWLLLFLLASLVLGGCGVESAQSVATATPRLEPRPGSAIKLDIWAARDRVDSSQQQEIWARVRQGDYPYLNVQPVLIIVLPDGRQQPYIMPPTDAKGETHLYLPAVAAANGTLLPYEICVAVPAQGKVCVQDSYLIWNELTSGNQ
jgi:hypothetical protein